MATSTTPTPTALSVTITPSSAGAKIALSLSGGYSIRNYNSGYIMLYRDGQNTMAGPSYWSRLFFGAASGDEMKNFSIDYVDAPGTTAAVTYQIYLAVDNNAAVNQFCLAARCTDALDMGRVTLIAREL